MTARTEILPAVPAPTLPDAENINVFNRRISGKGDIQGKRSVKDVKLHKLIPENKFGAVQYLSVNASKSSERNNVYLMVINKNLEKSVISDIQLHGFETNSVGNVWTLNGPSYLSTNEENHDLIQVIHREFAIDGSTFE